jgi:hypothetical protein
MANTTNFNWETPDDTDLVKDGAAAIRTLGSAIDTSLVDLKGGTTDQVLAKNSNTDMDFKWVTSDDANAIQNAIVDAKGDLIAASAADTPARLAVGTDNYRLVAASGETTGLKYVADTQNTVIDAAGDLVYGTAADTLGRLAIGTAGQILTVNSGATAPEWKTAASGGGMTLLSTTTLSSATTTISVDSGYIDLVIYFTGVYLPSASQGLTIRYNSVNSGYNSAYIYQASGAATLENRNNQGEIGTEGTAISDANNQYMFGYVRFFDYLGTAGMKTYQGQIVGRNDSEVYFARTFFGANSATPAAITGITFGTGAASFSGGTVKIYGVK